MCYKNVLPLFIVVVAIAIQNTTAKMCAGCPMRQNPDNFDMKKLALVLSTVNCNVGVEKVISVNTQVVAGVRYTVLFKATNGKICESSWIEIPWESKAPVAVKVSCKASFEELDGVMKLINAHKQERRDAPTLSAEAEALYREHIGEMMTNQGNSENVQIVTDMQVKNVELYGHGYKIRAVVELAYTNCIRSTRYALKDCQIDSNQSRRHCSLTAIMVQPQGGRKWYKISDVVCDA